MASWIAVGISGFLMIFGKIGLEALQKKSIFRPLA
jgi:hypothetical protein